MHPTIDEQLEGAQRLLDLVAADPQLSPESAESLANVRRLLKQVGRSWSTLLPFYTRDNAELRDLLARLGPMLLGDSAGDVRDWQDAPNGPDASDDSGAPDEGTPVGNDTDRALEVERAAARNAKLRQLLSAAIAALPDTDEGRAARDDVGAYLRARVAKDPT